MALIEDCLPRDAADKSSDSSLYSTVDSSPASQIRELRVIPQKSTQAQTETERPSIADTAKLVPDNGLWTIHGSRYDLRAFAESHPGGKHAILLGQGIDCTVLFETHHLFTDRHRAILKRYKYDDNADPMLVDTSYDWVRTPFYDDIKIAARRFFSPRGDESSREINRNSKATWTAVFIHGIKLSILICTFVLWLRDAPWSTVYFAVMYWLAAGEFGHNGSHFEMATWPWVNTVSSYINALHYQHHCWALQHVVGHHSHPNILDKDPDMHHFHKDKPNERWMAGFRVHPEEKILPKYALYWQFAVVYHMVATTLAIALVNLPRWLEEKSVEVIPLPARLRRTIILDRLLVLAGIALFIYTRDSAVAGFFKVFWSLVVHGVIFSFFSQITHVNEQCMVALDAYRKKQDLSKVEWATQQVLTASDYSCDSFIISSLAISLNHQICHHLLPTVHPCHYRDLRRILIPIAAKHGIDYDSRSNRSIWTACLDTMKWIFKLNHTDMTSYLVNAGISSAFLLIITLVPVTLGG